jgi:2-isopropylmalate synthase
LIFSHLLAKLPILKRNNVILSCHCHNDLGLAVANSLAAIENGARQAECTINGIGERAGNAAMEEIVMALRTRIDHFKIGSRIDISKIYPASRMVSMLTGLIVQRNKAIVGENAFAHEAGIHQDGIIKNPLTYEIISPEAVGVPSRSLVLGKHSGRHALRQTLQDLGYSPSDAELAECYRRVTTFADQTKQVRARDIMAIAHQVINRKNDSVATGASSLV